MISKNKTFKIDDNYIFLYDKLERKNEIENLSSLIVSTKEAFTMSINADWGAGKTTFIKLWKEYLYKEHQVNSIYFSAWEDDFSKEPLISILGEINKYISENFNNKPEVLKKFNKVKEFGGKVLKRGVPAFIKGATAGVLDVDKGYEAAIGAITEQTTKDLIENYSKEKDITIKFQESIQILLSNIDNNKPFVVFIDELDRCRPLYAIELLEKVKHMFGIDGLIFVLSIDKKQLCESIKSQYGNIDAVNYLKRFIDLEYSLQNTNKDDFCTYLYSEKYEIYKVIKSKDIVKKYNSDIDHLAMIKYLAQSLSLTLREVEQAFIQINIVFKTMELRLLEAHFRVFIFFIFLKIKEQDLYFDLINKEKSSQEIIDNFFLNKKRHNSRQKLDIAIKSIIYATSTTNEELELMINKEKEKLKKISNASSIRYEEQKGLVDFLNYSYGEYNDYCLNELIDTVIKKIEFLDKFDFRVI